MALFLSTKKNHSERILKKLVEPNSMTEKNRKLFKPVGSRLGLLYSSCKLHNASVENCSPFRPILLALNTTTQKLAKFLVTILKPLISNEFTIRDSFRFAEEVVDQQPDFFVDSLDEDSLFANIYLEETIKICTNELFKESKNC